MPPLIFVATDGSARIGSPERQVIRRHCMRHKNKQPGSRRSRREAARAAAKSSQNSQKQDRLSSAVVKPVDAEEPLVSCSKLCSRAWDTHIYIGQCFIPPPPSDWALFRFPEELSISSQELMHQYYTRNPIRDMLYPFGYFGILVDFHDDPLWCFRSLCSEQLFFRAMLLLASASNDLILRQPLSKTTHRYLRSTLSILNHQLSDANAYIQNTILYIVGVLASIAILFGDYAAASAHAKGLSEIIRLRGSFGTDNYSPIIQFSIDRLNFSSMLVTKLWTPLYDSSVWEPPIFSDEVKKLYYSQRMLYVDIHVDPDLADVFHNLQYTTILFNKHYYEKTPVEGRFIRQCLGYVHSSLMELEGQHKNKLSECLLLGMMNFLGTTFRLPGLHDQYYCKSLGKRLELSYTIAKASAPNLPKTIDIWLMIVLLISTNNTDNMYVRASWQSTVAHKLSWEETRMHLKQVLWIDSLHDDLGRRAYESLMTENKRIDV